MATTGTQTHNLKADGAPFNEDGTPVHADKSTKGPGHGKCSCGNLSPELASRGERQKWHKTHKNFFATKGGTVQPEAEAEAEAEVQEQLANLVGDTVYDVDFPDNLPKRWHGELVNGARTVANVAFRDVYVAAGDTGVQISGVGPSVDAAAEAVQQLFAGAHDALADFTRTDADYTAAPKTGRAERKALKQLKVTFLHHYAVGVAAELERTR